MSKAEEEAERLKNEYYENILHINYSDSIKCSLILVEGIIDEYKGWGDHRGFNFDRLKFYQEVKQELKNMLKKK